MVSMDNDAVPVAIEEEATTPLPRQTMAELVFARCVCGCLESRHENGAGACIYCVDCAEFTVVCQVCADRGTVHVPEDDTYYPGSR